MSDIHEGGKNRFQWSESEDQKPERAIVLVPDFQKRSDQPEVHRSIEARLEEAVGLTVAINLEVVQTGVIPLKSIRPSTLMGKGKVEEIAGVIKAEEIGLAIIDHSLSPVQQRNLEEAWHCKVLDRTGLILEIFGDRAQTKEGRLQVDLAQLNYQKGRLVRQWTHLERQRGGAGFMGGPGETQIEADRREIQNKILRLESDLERVRKTRQLHRSQRKKVPHPIIALVGYTNAGKSTLFNKLTGADVMAKDMLFATLDPTLRQLVLPKGTKTILSDTVGFVSNLPTDLVAAFRATLEEVIEADLILHVRDIADSDSGAQAEDVYSILTQLGIENEGHKNVIEVWNKIDLLDKDALASIRATKSGETKPLLISAVTGQGLDQLLEIAEQHIAGSESVMEITLTPQQMDQISWIYQNTSVLEREDCENGDVWLKVTAAPAIREKLTRN
ncbi:MAG: GTPase HflX [Salaquimonas sp.]